jgi:hypothetical protein
MRGRICPKIERTPTRSDAGLASGTEWLGQISPALPAEQPEASVGPRSSNVTAAPRRASSRAQQTPIAPPPTIATSGLSTGGIVDLVHLAHRGPAAHRSREEVVAAGLEIKSVPDDSS